jgi:hypothetical protein
VRLTRPISWFLTAFGVWSLWIWVTFFKNLWADGEGLAFTGHDHSHPTAYFWVHAALAAASFVLGVAIGIIGLRGVLANRREAQAAEAQ